MDELDIRARGSRLAQLSLEQAKIARGVGDAILEFQESFEYIPGWLGHLKARCPELGDFSPADLSLFHRAACAYTSEEWDYSLPWCMYAYALRHTSDPAGWIRRAADENWKYSDLRKSILETKAESSHGDAPEDLIQPTEIMSLQVINPADHTCVGILTLYVDINDKYADPVATLELMTQELTAGGVTALREALQLCEFQIKEYLGLTCLQRDGSLNALVA